jgi:hypothetical protein
LLAKQSFNISIPSAKVIILYKDAVPNITNKVATLTLKAVPDYSIVVLLTILAALVTTLAPLTALVTTLALLAILAALTNTLALLTLPSLSLVTLAIQFA